MSTPDMAGDKKNVPSCVSPQAGMFGEQCAAMVALPRWTLKAFLEQAA